jgi:hypothetical protein
MGAMPKPNAAYVNGCLQVSAVVGLMMESWSASLLALAVLVGLGT